MLLKASGISYSVGRHGILRDVDVEVRQGESLAVVGPSGSGKTTLLAILGGLLTPQAGKVSCRGSRHLHVQDNVSWITQTVNILMDRSVIDNVSLGTFSAGVHRPAADERALTALASVNLDLPPETPIRHLSGGERQRAVIARALVSDRPYILADEPTGQLDTASTTVVVGALLRTTSTKGLVVVTHDMSVADRCDRGLVLRDGTVHPR